MSAQSSGSGPDLHEIFGMDVGDESSVVVETSEQDTDERDDTGAPADSERVSGAIHHSAPDGVAAPVASPRRPAGAPPRAS